jgi:hypothetical protein
MAKQVEAAAPRSVGKADSPKGTAHDSGEVVLGRERLERCTMTKKDGAVRRCWATIEQVGAERICDVGEEWQNEKPAGLDLPEINPGLTPTNLVEGQLTNVTGTQSVPSRQHKDRIVAPADGRRSVHGGQDAIHLCLTQHVGKADIPILSRSRDRIT